MMSKALSWAAAVLLAVNAFSLVALTAIKTQHPAYEVTLADLLWPCLSLVGAVLAAVLCEAAERRRKS